MSTLSCSDTVPHRRCKGVLRQADSLLHAAEAHGSTVCRLFAKLEDGLQTDSNAGERLTALT